VIKRILLVLALVSCSSALAGCGGGKAKPSEPKASQSAADESAESSAEPEASDQESKDESAESSATASAGEKKPDQGTSAPAADPEPTTTRTPKDIIGAPNVTFVLSFTSSEAGEKADRNCGKKPKDNPKKHNQCMAKERKKIVDDAVSFSQDKGGKWWWVTARMQGSKMIILHKLEFEFGEEKADSVIIKTIGKDKGGKPLRFPPRQITVKVPNEFSIELNDPKHGKMVYEAKIGIAGDR
jgi:hypothetical protein